ncbi:hypothetical protein B9H02_11375 [Prosthecochloris sp. HL-130-GSB]|nr:hypothetical protein B9H02_11375 [Prosthecochloris sp. HL-130-GSB]
MKKISRYVSRAFEAIPDEPMDAAHELWAFLFFLIHDDTTTCMTHRLRTITHKHIHHEKTIPEHIFKKPTTIAYINYIEINTQ